jgi:DNA-binding response OmpR family regulator
MPSRILVVDDSPTIRRVVSAILERHGYEPALAFDGQDAYEALSSGEVKADLVLLDFVMPRMNGYQFCRELRANEELSGVPVVLMSAKADRIREKFVQQTGAVDAISKPFDAQALVAVVENALRRVGTASRASSARLPELEPEDLAPDTVVPPLEHETRRTHIAQIVAAKLVQLVTDALEDKPGAPPADLVAWLTERLAQDALLEMMEAVRDLRGAERGGPPLAGDLAMIPIGAVLQLLQVENKSGVLVCRSASAEVKATFRTGLIDLVQSSGAGDEFRIGRFFVEEGILTPAEIDAVLVEPGGAEREPSSRTVVKDASSGPTLSSLSADRAPETVRVGAHGRITMPPLTLPWPPPMAPRPSGFEKPLGSRLLAAGKITEGQLKSALVRQSSELLYEVIRWPTGRFELLGEPPGGLAESARLGLPVASVVMEGFRRVDEWRLLERTLGSFDAVLVRDDVALGTLDVEALPSKEKVVLDLVDGARTVRSVITASHMSSFDACRILVSFLEARVLRRR